MALFVGQKQVAEQNRAGPAEEYDLRQNGLKPLQHPVPSAIRDASLDRVVLIFPAFFVSSFPIVFPSRTTEFTNLRGSFRNSSPFSMTFVAAVRTFFWTSEASLRLSAAMVSTRLEALFQAWSIGAGTLNGTETVERRVRLARGEVFLAVAFGVDFIGFSFSLGPRCGVF